MISLGERLSEAELALRMGDVDTAERLYEALGRQPLSSGARARLLTGLGQIAFGREELSTTIQLMEEAREVLSGGPLPPEAVDTLSRAYAMTGRLESSIGVLERALQQAEEDGDRPSCERFRVLLANALIDGGRFSEAEARLAPLLGDGEGGDRLNRARVEWTRSRLHTLQNQHELAAECARRVLELLEDCEDTEYRSRALQMAAHVEIACGRPGEALDLLAGAEDLLGPDAGALDRGKLVLERARVMLVLGEAEAAARLAQEAAALLARVDAHDCGRAYLLLADVLLHLGERDRAIEIYELAEELLADAPSRFLVEALRRHAEALDQEHSVDDAIRLLKRALALQKGWRTTRPPGL